MKLTKSKYSIPAQSNTRARVRIASWLWLGILNCLALVTWHQSTEPKALSNSLSGPAWVRDIEPCQGVLPGDGHVITATFLHSSGDVIDLVWSDDESRNLESVGTTSNHPFYSFDRGDYVQAGSLQEGERLLTYSGDTKRVVSKLARPGPETVYNLEVFGEHVYFIGHDGVLVHNSDSYGLNAVAPKGRFPDSGFDVSVNPGRGVTGIDVNYRGPGNVGVVQSTFTSQTGELYIDLAKSQVQRAGLAQELLGRAIRVAEQSGTKVNTVAGHLRGVNKDILLLEGLEASPAYKLRLRAGFTRVIEAPTEANGFSLIMGR